MNFIAKVFDELTTAELYELLKARAKIFVQEQGIRYVDMDDVDYKSLHCFFEDDGKVAACLRAYYLDDNKVKIGRVLTRVHGAGLGKRLMDESLAAIKERMPCKKIHVSAQKHAAGFYAKAGFKVTSGDYLEEGVVHVAMEMEL